MKHGDDPSSDAPPEKLVGALTSGLRVTRYLCATGGRAGVSRIARDLQLNPSTCFNLLKTLVHEGVVSFDAATKTYGIGLGLVELAKGAIEQATYARLVHPHLQAVATAHGVTATLWQRTTGERVVLVDRADNGAAVRVHMSIGQRLPMYVAALGRCMAAHSGLDRAQVRQRFESLRWEEVPTFEEYWKGVQEARARGYATDIGNYVKGVTTASAAVIESSGQAIMAISAVGFAASLTRSSLKALGEDLRDRAAHVSRALSGMPAVSSATRDPTAR